MIYGLSYPDKCVICNPILKPESKAVNIYLMKSALAYLQLYRLDAFAITLLSYLVPLLVFRTYFLPIDFLTAFLISGISINSVYSLNSWFDKDIDKVNKPHRPIPAGRITERSAIVYALALVVVSLVYPWFLCVPLITKLLLLSIPFSGLLYSNTIFPFKKKMYLSVTLTSYLMVAPVLVALTGNNYFAGHEYVPLYLFLYCLATIPLKDIEDEKGDVMYQSQNWADKVGRYSLFWISAALLSLIAITSFFLIPVPIYRLFLAGFCISTAMFLIITALYLKVPSDKIYRMLIKFDIIQGLCFMVAYKFFA
jgi:4-hydroxybenzoate polyprenyltransferase